MRLRAVPALLGGLAAVSLTLGACGSSTPAAKAPSPSHTDRILTASVGHPSLSVQGEAVQVDLPSSSVLANVSGPQVPPFVTPPPPAVTCTFTVTLTKVTGTVPISIDDFSIATQSGRLLRPTFVGAAPPASVTTGSTVSFQLTAFLPTGEGRVYWAPTGGANALVAWDFVVEND